MTAELEFHQFNDGAGVQPIRSLVIDKGIEGPQRWFVASDIADRMGMITGNMTRLASGENLTRAPHQTEGGIQFVNVINVAGIIEVATKTRSSRTDYAARVRDFAVSVASAAVEQQVFPTPATHLHAVPTSAPAAPSGQIVSLDDMERLAAAVMQAVSIAREQQARADSLEANLTVVRQDLEAANRAVEVWTEDDAQHDVRTAAQWLASQGIKAPSGKPIGRTYLYAYLRQIGWVCQGTRQPKQTAVDALNVTVHQTRIEGRVEIGTRITSKGLDLLFRRMSAAPTLALEAATS
jgi:hypothetical protein